MNHEINIYWNETFKDPTTFKLLSWLFRISCFPSFTKEKRAHSKQCPRTNIFLTCHSHRSPNPKSSPYPHPNPYIYAAKVYVAPAAWPLRNHKISNMSHKWWFDIFSIYGLFFCSPIARRIANFKYPGWPRRHPHHMMMMTEMCTLPPTRGHFC